MTRAVQRAMRWSERMWAAGSWPRIISIGSYVLHTTFCRSERERCAGRPFAERVRVFLPSGSAFSFGRGSKAVGTEVFGFG